MSNLHEGFSFSAVLARFFQMCEKFQAIDFEFVALETSGVMRLVGPATRYFRKLTRNPVGSLQAEYRSWLLVIPI